MTRRRYRVTETGRLVPCSFLENTVQYAILQKKRR